MLLNYFEDRECMHYSVLILISFFLLVHIVPGFCQNSFEKWQVAACRSSKEFCANLRNVSANRKRAIALS
jgi:hypothetical protein